MNRTLSLSICYCICFFFCSCSVLHTPRQQTFKQYTKRRVLSLSLLNNQRFVLVNRFYCPGIDDSLSIISQEGRYIVTEAYLVLIRDSTAGSKAFYDIPAQNCKSCSFLSASARNESSGLHHYPSPYSKHGLVPLISKDTLVYSDDRKTLALVKQDSDNRYIYLLSTPKKERIRRIKLFFYKIRLFFDKQDYIPSKEYILNNMY